MRCTIFQLYALCMGTSVCGGPRVTFKELTKTSAVNFLTNNKCYKKGSEYSMAQVILNKMTPEQVNMDKLGELDICESHKIYLTRKHKSVKQKTCALEDCSKLGETDKPRVTFEVSAAAYRVSGLHILVGSTLCSNHRKVISCQSHSSVPNVSQTISSHSESSSQPLATNDPQTLDNQVTSCFLQVPTSLPNVTINHTSLTQVTSGGSSLTNVTSSFITKPHLSSLPPNTSVTPVSPSPTHVTETLSSTQDTQGNEFLSSGKFTSKRKSFAEALERLPKLARIDSLGDSESNSQNKLSQGSNYSASSEADTDKKQVQFSQVLSCLTMLDPVLGSSISAPLDLQVQARTLQR